MFDKLYFDLARQVIETGNEYETRGKSCVGIGPLSLVVDLQAGFPLLQLRRVPWKLYLKEYLWEFNGGIAYDPDASKFWQQYVIDGNVMSAYGQAWRHFPPYADLLEGQRQHGCDQFAWLYRLLTADAYTRNAVLYTAIPMIGASKYCQPCHPVAQFFVDRATGHLCLHVFGRSNDIALGFPNDVCRYALLTHTMAAALCRPVGKLFLSITDLHCYKANLAELTRLVDHCQSHGLPSTSPEVTYSGPTGYSAIVEQKFESWSLTGYNPMAIKVRFSLE